MKEGLRATLVRATVDTVLLENLFNERIDDVWRDIRNKLYENLRFITTVSSVTYTSLDDGMLEGVNYIVYFTEENGETHHIDFTIVSSSDWHI